jgi:hypothetical protein
MAVFYADFPSSLGKEVSAGHHYMLIDSFESKNAITTGNTKLSSIGLYIPAGSLKTSYTGNYEGKEGARAAATISEGTGFSGSFDITKLATAVVTKIGSTAAAAADSTGFLSASGLTPNNHMALVYKGPNSFRQHAFTFLFFPKNSSESSKVKQIIDEFKRGTLPRMSGGDASAQTLSDPFFKSPRQHTIKFCKGAKSVGADGQENPYLFEIGTSVITQMDVNYDPQSVVGFHDDGHPVSISLSLTFQEIELQISKDNAKARNLDLSGSVLQAQASSSQTAAEFTESRTNTAGFLTDGRGF